MPLYKQKELLPFEKYKAVLIKRSLQVLETENNLSPHKDKDNKDNKDHKETRDKSETQHKKVKLFTNSAQDNIVIENKIISCKQDDSSAMFSPKNKSNKNTYKANTKNQFSPEQIFKAPFKADGKTLEGFTIGFVSKDDKVVCDDFKAEMQKIDF